MPSFQDIEMLTTGNCPMSFSCGSKYSLSLSLPHSRTYRHHSQELLLLLDTPAPSIFGEDHQSSPYWYPPCKATCVCRNRTHIGQLTHRHLLPLSFWDQDVRSSSLLDPGWADWGVKGRGQSPLPNWWHISDLVDMAPQSWWLCLLSCLPVYICDQCPLI